MLYCIALFHAQQLTADVHKYSGHCKPSKHDASHCPNKYLDNCAGVTKRTKEKGQQPGFVISQRFHPYNFHPGVFVYIWPTARLRMLLTPRMTNSGIVTGYWQQLVSTVSRLQGHKRHICRVSAISRLLSAPGHKMLRLDCDNRASYFGLCRRDWYRRCSTLAPAVVTILGSLLSSTCKDLTGAERAHSTER